jgi:hypothetical protein
MSAVKDPALSWLQKTLLQALVAGMEQADAEHDHFGYVEIHYYLVHLLQGITLQFSPPMPPTLTSVPSQGFPPCSAPPIPPATCMPLHPRGAPSPVTVSCTACSRWFTTLRCLRRHNRIHASKLPGHIRTPIPGPAAVTPTTQSCETAT